MFRMVIERLYLPELSKVDESDKKVMRHRGHSFALRSIADDQWSLFRSIVVTIGASVVATIRIKSRTANDVRCGEEETSARSRRRIYRWIGRHARSVDLA